MFAEDKAVHALRCASGRKIMDKTSKNHFTAAIIAVITMGLAAVGASAGGFLDVDFAPGNFGASTNINNDYWPLAPGGAATTFIYLGDTEDGCVFDKVESDPALVKTFTALQQISTTIIGHWRPVLLKYCSSKNPASAGVLRCSIPPPTTARPLSIGIGGNPNKRMAGSYW
jgi:hypothetical protein